MKTVKSVSDLKRLAVQQGATVELGTARFNTSGEKITRLQRAPASAPEPTPAPPPPPPAAPAPAPEVRVDMAAVADAQMKMGEMLARALASHPIPPAPVREWLFTVERDENGLLTTIRATAQE